MKTLQNGIIYILMTVSLFLASCGRGEHNTEQKFAVDSLCSVISENRYSNLSLLDTLANAIYDTAVFSNEQQMIALNSIAYSSLMSMDYGKAVELYRSVIENSECEIERLVADVGLMTVCYRVSENRLFFDYRASALSRIRRINEEYEYLAPGDKERFNSAKIEFCIVSICYFSNLSMQDEAERVLEHLEEIIKNTNERTPRLYARMMLANSEPNALKRLTALGTGLAVAEKNGYVWLEANYKLLLAIALRDSDMIRIFATEYPELVAVMLPQGFSVEELSLCLASDAVRQFALFGDNYMMIEAMAVKASCCTALGRYEDAIVLLDTAYSSINDYYSHYYPAVPITSLDSLLFYIGEGGDMSTDLVAGMYNIPECLLSVCREASCAYAGIGDKFASDINREAYLELLRTTRLNKMLESRVSSAETKLSRLRITAVLALLSLVTVSVVLAFVYGKRKHRERYYSKDRKRLLKVSRLLLSAIPHDVDDKQLLCEVITGVLNEQLGNFAGKTSFYVGGEAPAGETKPFINTFEIRYMNSGGGDVLAVASEQQLDSNRKELIELLLPYVAVAVEEGMRLAGIGEEREKVEELRRMAAIYYAEHKRENLLKRVSVSVVSAMRPFMDRIINELNVLRGCSVGEERVRKLKFVAELTEKLEDLNQILERWIKTRQGELNLRIENFPLSSIFEIVEKNRLMMEKKRLEFIVKGGDEVVKADKALTLFMINTLVDNAAKFTPEGGRVMLESFEAADYVEVAVSDTGIGLSQVDIDRIKGTKVYDSSLIGDDNELLKAGSKGSGFGLMNSKGIIEKYRKTDSLFSVCSFDISSIKGKGSRFSFRLPKGVMRCMLLLLTMLPFQSKAVDGFFDNLNVHADSVFMSNVNGDYEEAFIEAGKAIGLLNSYYKEQVGGTDTLSLYEGSAAELVWWRKELFPDSLHEAIFYNILDIRNEVAVASLALNEWEAYRYNNRIYSTLYRLVHEDKGIAERYSAMQQHTNGYEVAIALSLLIMLLLLFYYVASFVRYNIIERTNERLVLDMNSRLQRVASGNGRSSVLELAQAITDELYDCIGETMRVSSVAMLLKCNEADTVLAESPATIMHGRTDIYMQRVMVDGEAFVSTDSLLRVMPLVVVIKGANVVVGAMKIVTERPLNENEVVSLELVMGYLASVAYHAAVRVASGYLALEELEEETARLNNEDNRLHVQNMVIDNCLSVIKHETIYYPSRIRKLANSALEAPATSDKAVLDMSELMNYYSSVFGILGNCVMRELDDMSFSLSKSELSHFFSKAKGFVERHAKKAGLDVKLMCEETDVVVNVDSTLVEYLFEQLLTAALKVYKNGVMTLSAIDAGDVVRVELADSRYELSSEELAELFTPTRRNIKGENDSMEYLVAKEIVRLHEDYTGKHGGRMEARSDVSGTVIVFTLPKVMFNV